MKRYALKKSQFLRGIPERKAIIERQVPEYRNPIEVPDRKKESVELSRCHVWNNASDMAEMRQWTIVNARISHARNAFSQCIDIDPQIMSGIPVVKNTRMPVSMVLANVAANMSLAEMAEDLNLEMESLVLSIRCLASVFDRPAHEYHSARRMYDVQALDEIMCARRKDDDPSVSGVYGR